MPAKTKKKTNSKKTPRTETGLVATQRDALNAIPTKRALAGLAVKLAAQHGTSEQQALKRSEIEALKRDEITALVEEFALRSHQRKRVHLSELGGWPVCWSDEKRDAVKPKELLMTPIAVHAEAVTCSRCKKGAELPSPEETAALKRAELDAERQPKKGKRAKAKGKKSETPSTRTKRHVRLKKNLPVRMKIKDLEVKGVLRPDGTMSVKGKSYDSPHVAANELAGDLVAYRIDGFQAWRFQDEDGKWRMLRDYA